MDLLVVVQLGVGFLGISQAYKCDGLPKSSIAVTELTTDFKFNRTENVFDSKLKVVYEWKVIDSKTKDPVSSTFDGFLYKFSTRETLGNYLNPFHVPLYGIEDECVGAKGKVWSRVSDAPCELPCKGRFSPSCNDSIVCTMLKHGYETVSSKTRKLEFPAKFGSVFDIHVLPYNNWIIGHGSEVTGTGVVRYCKDELIQRQNFTVDEAHEYCKNVSMFSGEEAYSGPVSHFQKYKVTVDFGRNRAKVSFRWKKPYDYHPNATLKNYVTVVNRTRPYRQNLSDTEYNAFTVDNVTIEENLTLEVIPRLNYSVNPDAWSYVYGAAITEDFKVVDFDACSESNDVGGRYCDLIANCTDLPSNASVSATCVCPSGFSGNGIALKWQGGEGCTDQSSNIPSIAAGISCSLLVLLMIVLISIYAKQRKQSRVKRKILKEENVDID